jgi:phosphoglycerate dehydrogenase-like enzyme
MTRRRTIGPCVVESLPHLRIVSKYGAGRDNIDIKVATEKEMWFYLSTQ